MILKFCKKILRNLGYRVFCANSPDLSKKPEIVYWLREARSSNAEVDYVISIGNWIIPVK